MPVTITPEILTAIAPAAGTPEWAPHIIDGMRKFGVDRSALSAAMFLGTCAEETGGFQKAGREESGWYSPDRIVQIWPWISAAKAAELAQDRTGAATRNYAYDDRQRGPGLGNIFDGDGEKYKGRGIIQLTGRWLYTKYASACGDQDVVSSPERVATDTHHAVGSACWYWSFARCADVAETGNFRELTRKVNGSTLNMDERLRYYTAAAFALGLNSAGAGWKEDGREVTTKTIQMALEKAGFPCGGVDGIDGPKTHVAVAAFQRSRGLVVDGVPGPATKAALGLA